LEHSSELPSQIAVPHKQPALVDFGMASGRVQCLLIATRSGHVVYERFYDTFGDEEKANIRAAFDHASSTDEAREAQELVGRYK